jgi:hypothetical protein
MLLTGQNSDANAGKSGEFLHSVLVRAIPDVQSLVIGARSVDLQRERKRERKREEMVL